MTKWVKSNNGTARTVWCVQKIPSLQCNGASNKEKTMFRPLMFIMLMYRGPCEFHNHTILDRINRQNKNAICR